jgi:hypothetical protein
VQLYDEFNDPVSGNPVVRVYQERLPEPVKGSVGQEVRFSVEDRTFQGIIKQIDQVKAVVVLG